MDKVEEERIHEFAALAREYCSWAQTPSTQTPAEEAMTALRLLVNLYRLALALPEGEGGSDVESTTQEEWQGVYRRFASLPVDLYSEVFDPLEFPPAEPVGASLGDDLADIYRDLKGGLLLYDRGDLSGATWEWAFHFRAHWGHHATGALYALHAWWVEDYFNDLSAEPEPHESS